MVRLRSDEVGDAKSVIEPLVADVLPNTELEILAGEDLGVATAELIIRRQGRAARCIVTFEAWEQARKNPDRMRATLRRIGSDMEGAGTLPVYLVTSRGLDTESANKSSLDLSTIAHGIEADVLAERFFKRALHR